MRVRTYTEKRENVLIKCTFGNFKFEAEIHRSELFQQQKVEMTTAKLAMSPAKLNRAGENALERPPRATIILPDTIEMRIYLSSLVSP